MTIRFLISTQQSGSHLLKSGIESRFDSTICSGEILGPPCAGAHQQSPLFAHPEIIPFWSWYEGEASAGRISVAPDRRFEAFARYLDMLSSQLPADRVILDLKYNSIRTLSGYWDTDHGSLDFVKFVREQEIPVLHLLRRNYLRVLVSAQLAQTGVGHRDRNPDAPLPKIRLNPKSVLHEIRYGVSLTRHYTDHFRGYPGYTEVFYEDLLGDDSFSPSKPGGRALAQFLPDAPVRSETATVPFHKATPDQLFEVVENWSEIVRVLRSTEHGWMTEAPLLAVA